MKPASICATGLAVLLLQAGAWAQVPLGPPLHVGMTNSVRDEFGEMLKGVTPASADLGSPGEVVQILLVTTNGVFPPDRSGVPDARNPILFQGRVGDGLDPSAGKTGRFGFSIPGRPVGQSVIARVFNRSDLSQASFYADSQTFAVDQAFNQAFIPVVSQTLLPLDTSDDDGDGLNGSWEKSLGADPANPDTDGDGVSDEQEWRAGTALTNRASHLAMVQLKKLGSRVMDVQWDSVAGKQYQLDLCAGDLLSEMPYAPVSPVIMATGSTTQISVTNEESGASGHYRIRLVEP